MKRKSLPPLIAAGARQFDAVAAGGGDNTGGRFAPYAATLLSSIDGDSADADCAWNNMTLSEKQSETLDCIVDRRSYRK